MELENFISNLTHDQKLAAMDILWRELSEKSEGKQVSSPSWHGELIAYRLANPEAVKRTPLEQAKVELREELDARRTTE